MKYHRHGGSWPGYLVHHCGTPGMIRRGRARGEWVPHRTIAAACGSCSHSSSSMSESRTRKLRRSSDAIPTPPVHDHDESSREYHSDGPDSPASSHRGDDTSSSALGYKVSSYDRGRKSLVGLYEGRTSLLSSENKEHVSFRGALNLALILLIFANLRTVVSNIILVGNRININHLIVVDTTRWPGIALAAFLNLFLICSYLVERAAVGGMKDSTVDVLQAVNVAAAVIIPSALVWVVRPNPATGVLLMCGVCVVMMKLISYWRVNSQLRAMWRSSHKKSSDGYPHNISLFNLYWFMCLPFLVYQIEYPRTPKIRWTFLFSRLGQMVFLGALGYIMVEQYIIPVLDTSVEALDNADVLGIIAAVLRLALPHIYVWLIFFYIFFHLWLNVLAEITRVGDRCYYRDWWNSTGLDYFWRTWNIPVHHWMNVHVYTPMRKRKYSRHFAVFVVFVISGFFHELVVSVPFHTIKLWAFFGLLGQLPLITITRGLVHGQTGNVVFWVSFILGQPTLTMMYHYAVMKEHLLD
eukprot:TRINITY_DN2858_c0_g1_i2.p1 TRINITY_DN2858_c0_g1~~TRINITY_DN2858_c0_g1_i2.p1  ORF type:complete len:524 (+),score=73.50 TRINITY_DN2858_c0_g1_i2:230-1801(+)